MQNQMKTSCDNFTVTDERKSGRGRDAERQREKKRQAQTARYKLAHYFLLYRQPNLTFVSRLLTEPIMNICSLNAFLYLTNCTLL